MTLSLLAHAYLAVLRSDAHDAAWELEAKRGDRDPELIPPTVAEVRRLILAMSGPEEEREFWLIPRG